MNKTLLSIPFTLFAAVLVGCSTPVDLSETPSRESEETPSAVTQPSTSQASDDTLSGMSSTGDPEYRCDADPAQALLGETINSDVEARARELSGSKTVRTLRPNNVITMEYNPQRINLRVDEQDVITSAGCG
ncbi:MAG TPA: I78 family peptidase inhibitor [Burkholderiaceae bacterium]|nr:I78 family peptidase inhibitor [Burkholderiaceae bacterium]